MSEFSVREQQKAAIKAMLTLQRGDDAAPWKVLVYDEAGRDIISPLLNVGELREQGVTLHLALHAARQAVPDVPAVYFCRPTERNVARIAADLKQALYDQVHVNFIGDTPHAMLERLATDALAADSVARISRVHDQFVGFQALSPTLVSLGQRDSFVAFNDARASDQAAQANIARVVDGLFGVLAVSRVTPLIRCPRNGAAEMVARALAQRLHKHVEARAGVSDVDAHGDSGGAGGGSGGGGALSSFRRPVLVLLERTTDLATMLHHPWTYSAMVHDVLGMRLNRVRMPADGGDGDAAPAAGKERTFDLDARDHFWASNGGAPFQQVAVEVKQQLGQYQERLARLDALGENADGAGGDADAGDELGGFVSEIPELQAKKAVIETHTNIATALLKHIKRRELDRFYAIEETLLARGSCDRAELRHLLSGESGTELDRVRLLLVYYLCAVERAQPSSAVATEFGKLEQSMRSAGADLTALDYVRQMRAHIGALSLPSVGDGATGDDAGASGAAGASGGAGGDGPSWSALQKGYESLSTFTNIFSDGVEKLKTLLPREQELPVTRIVRALMERRPLKGVEQYLQFDPMVDGGRGSAVTDDASSGATGDDNDDSASRSAFREAIVFVIGGGNYIEYQNLQDYAAGALESKSKRGASAAGGAKKTIVYGATQLLTSSEMLDQIAQLAKIKK